MGAQIGKVDKDRDQELMEAFVTNVDSLRTAPVTASEVDETDETDAVDAVDAVDETDGQDEEKEPAKRPAAKKAPAKRATAKKAPAKKPRPEKPKIPAKYVPEQHKVAIPRELHYEMHSVLNAWLAGDLDRMYAYNKDLSVENTFLVTMLAYGTAKFREEINEVGGDHVTFPNYIPRKNRAGK